MSLSESSNPGIDYRLCSNCGEPAFAWMAEAFCCPCCGCDTYEEYEEYEEPDDDDDGALEIPGNNTGGLQNGIADGKVDILGELGESRKRKREGED